MEELELLRTRYLAMVADLRRQWWECSMQGQGNSDLAKLLWGMRSMFEHLARDIQVAQEDRGLQWLRTECEIHYRCRLRDLTPEWAEGQPSWFLWSSRRQAAVFRLTRQITAKALKGSSGMELRKETKMGILNKLFGHGDDNGQPKSEPLNDVADVCSEFNELEEQIERDSTGMSVQNNHNSRIFGRQQKILNELSEEGYKLDNDVVTRKWYAKDDLHY